MNRVLSFFLFSFCCMGIYAELQEPLSLQEAERLAMQNNLLVNESLYRVEAARAGRDHSYSAWSPAVAYTATATKWEHPTSIGLRERYTSALQLSQQLFSSGVYYNSKIAHLELLAALEAFEKSKNDVLLDVREAYYLVVRNQMEVQVQQENVVLLSEALQKEARRLEVGESTGFEVTQSKTRVANALSGYYQALKNLKTARNRLLNLLNLLSSHKGEVELEEEEINIFTVPDIAHKLKALGVEQGEESATLETLFDPESLFEHLRQDLFSSHEVQQWHDLALHHRPDLKRQEILVKQAKKNVSKKRGEHLPTLKAFAHYQTQNPDGRGFRHMDCSWDMGIEFSLPLFKGFGTVYETRQAQAGVEVAEEAYQRAREETYLAVDNAFLDMEEALLTFFAAYKGVALSNLAIDQAKSRLELGVITTLEYRETVADHTQARSALNGASYNLLKAYYALRHAAGVDMLEGGRNFTVKAHG